MKKKKEDWLYNWLSKHPKVFKAIGIITWLSYAYFMIYVILKLIGVINSPDGTMLLTVGLFLGGFLGRTEMRMRNMEKRMDKMGGDIDHIKDEIIALKERVWGVESDIKIIKG